MLEKFKEYVDSFEKEDAIKYKYNHSLRVMDLSIDIAKSLKLNEEDLKLVKLIGLLHDIGRFKQWNIYKSFSDSSIDHGDLGVKILFEEKEIEKYDLDKKYYQIVKDAIKYHNKYEIGSVTNSLFCKIIRDADKLDIIKEFDKSLFRGINEKYIHPEVKESFYNHQQVKKIKDSTNLDKLIIKLALIYDLNFDYSFRYLKENKIIAEIQKQSNIKELDSYFKEIKKYMEDKIC